MKIDLKNRLYSHLRFTRNHEGATMVDLMMLSLGIGVLATTMIGLFTSQANDRRKLKINEAYREIQRRVATAATDPGALFMSSITGSANLQAACAPAAAKTELLQCTDNKVVMNPPPKTGNNFACTGAALDCTEDTGPSTTADPGDPFILMSRNGEPITGTYNAQGAHCNTNLVATAACPFVVRTHFKSICPPDQPGTCSKAQHVKVFWRLSQDVPLTANGQADGPRVNYTLPPVRVTDLPTLAASDADYGQNAVPIATNLITGAAGESAVCPDGFIIEGTDTVGGWRCIPDPARCDYEKALVLEGCPKDIHPPAVLPVTSPFCPAGTTVKCPECSQQCPAAGDLVAWGRFACEAEYRICSNTKSCGINPVKCPPPDLTTITKTCTDTCVNPSTVACGKTVFAQCDGVPCKSLPGTLADPLLGTCGGTCSTYAKDRATACTTEMVACAIPATGAPAPGTKDCGGGGTCTPAVDPSTVCTTDPPIKCANDPTKLFGNGTKNCTPGECGARVSTNGTIFIPVNGEDSGLPCIGSKPVLNKGKDGDVAYAPNEDWGNPFTHPGCANCGSGTLCIIKNNAHEYKCTKKPDNTYDWTDTGKLVTQSGANGTPFRCVNPKCETTLSTY